MAILNLHFFSRCLKREVPLTALLPVDSPFLPAQEDSTFQPLKALYLLHGYSGTHSDWVNFSRIRELSDRYRIAVFMPSGENHFYVDDEDKGALYGEYIGRELIDFTRKLFPLSSSREDTLIGGLSMGGYGAIRNGYKYSDRYGHIIALSSALIPYKIANMEPGFKDGIADYGYYRSVFGDLTKLLGSDKDPEAIVRRLCERGEELPNLYMACGTEDFLLDVNRRFHHFLEANKVEHTYRESAGAHTWDFWNETIADGLNWALGEPPAYPKAD
ncbi:alpha/beta hydrolase [Cohnella thailandensis]|uniref:Acetylesterase n=1 Tax=Cohnella thailandensis TaxID=557557 RepID=A0A841SVG5_9BACL|nr:alpha/beta hydrolase-fold protein [Cohnella thailandensis]MBB6634596.1 acetylesterase [Cohnella thailandensis]MBP1972848.1 S-formylglutathione hydrolase FrmB [Cohnella thailandensis]